MKRWTKGPVEIREKGSWESMEVSACRWRGYLPSCYGGFLTIPWILFEVWQWEVSFWLYWHFLSGSLRPGPLKPREKTAQDITSNLKFHCFPQNIFFWVPTRSVEVSLLPRTWTQVLHLSGERSQRNPMTSLKSTSFQHGVWESFPVVWCVGVASKACGSSHVQKMDSSFKTVAMLAKSEDKNISL